MLALELHRQGIDCVVIDRKLTRQSQAGGLALSSRSLELLDRVGVLEGCLERSVKLNGTRLFAPGGRSRFAPFASLSGDPARPYAAVRILAQQALESELRQRAAAFGCYVNGGLSFAGYEPATESSRVLVNLVSSQGLEFSASCRFLVGCDGPYSSVRQAAEIGFPGRTLDWIYSIGEFEVSWDLPPNEMFEFLGEGRLLVVLPLPESGRYRLTTWEPAPPSRYPERVEHGPLVSPPTHRDFQEVVDDVVPFPTKLRNPDNLFCYRVGRRLAERFRAGSVCLAGDAAHAFPPATGLGMNLGLEDAFVLASKIAAGGGEELIESYHEERYAASQHALLQTEAAMMELTRTVMQPHLDEEYGRDVLTEHWSQHERFFSQGSAN